MVIPETMKLTFSSRMRWLLLLSFPVAAASALSAGSGSEPVLYLLLAMGACAYLLNRLDSVRAETAAVWLVLSVFIVFYFLRYPYLMFDPTPVIATHPDSISTFFRNNGDGLGEALAFSALAFCSFCLTAGALLGRLNAAQNWTDDMPREAITRMASALMIVIPLLMLVLGYVTYVHHIGQMGVPTGEPLPFRLKGIVFYGRTVVLPLMILALINFGTKLDSRPLALLGVSLLVVHGVSDMMLRGSRSSLLLCLLLALFLIVGRGFKVRRMGLVIMAALVLAAIWLMPIVLQYRMLRMHSDAGLWGLMQQAFAASHDDALALLKHALLNVYYRIPGIETAWAIINVDGKPLGSALWTTVRSPFGMTGYLNFTLYHVPAEENTLYAPGFIGWLYLAGGHVLLLLGPALLAWVCVRVPCWVFTSGSPNAPIVNAFLLWILFLTLTDGTPDANVLLITSGLVALAGWELIGKWVRRRQPQVRR